MPPYERLPRARTRCAPYYYSQETPQPRARLILMRSIASCYAQPRQAGTAFGGRWARVREFVAEPASGAGSEPICVVAHPPFADASASQNDRVWRPCYSLSPGLYCSACASGCPDVCDRPARLCILSLRVYLPLRRASFPSPLLCLLRLAPPACPSRPARACCALHSWARKTQPATRESCSPRPMGE